MKLSIKLPHLVKCSSSLSGCANQRSNFTFLFPEGDAEGKIDHSFLMKSVNSVKPRFSVLSWGEGEMHSRCPSSPALSVKPHLQSLAGLYGFSLFPGLVWILGQQNGDFFLFFWVRGCAPYLQSWVQCGESHPFMSCSSREPVAVSLPVGCVWHSAIQRGGLTLGLSHFSERKNLKILWPQLFCYVCKQSGKWGQDINTSQMRTGKSLQAKAVCHAWKHRLRCQRQAVMRKLFQQSCFIRDPGQTALYPGGRLSASCWENTYQRSLLGNCGSTNAALQLGLNHLCGWKDEFRDVNQP